MGSLERQLLRALNSGSGERKVHAFLKAHPYLISQAFNLAWNFWRCITEFRMGTDHRCDFLLISASSCSWNTIFIELESPKSRLYLKDGTPAKSLRIAERQLKDWRSWVRINQDTLRRDLSKILRAERAGAQCSPVDSHTKAYTEILDCHTVIHEYYHVVIGRRASLSPDEQRRRVMESQFRGGSDIATYDRLLDCARRSDEAQHQIRQREKAPSAY